MRTLRWQTISLAWPLFLNALLHQSMVVVDTLLVSPLGTDEVAALGVASTLMFFCLGVQFAFASGTQLVLARCFGADSNCEARLQFRAGCWIVIAPTLLFSTLLLWSPLFLLEKLAETPDIARLIADYLRIAAVTLIFSGVSQIYIARLNAAGFTRIPLTGLLLEIPLNILASLLLIYGVGGWFEGIGLPGAALGSLFAILIRAVYISLRSRAIFQVKPLRQGFKRTTSRLLVHLSESGPIALNYLTLTTGIMVFQLLFSQLPVAEYAAIVLLLPWIRMGGQVGTTWGQATSILISRLLGQKSSEIRDYVRDNVRITLLMEILVCLLFGLIALLLPAIYSTANGETLTAMRSLYFVFITLPLVRIVNTVIGQSLRAFQQSGFVLTVHFVTQWCVAIPVCIGFIYLQLPLHWVFSILLIEELLKTLPFLARLRKTVNAIRGQ